MDYIVRMDRMELTGEREMGAVKRVRGRPMAQRKCYNTVDSQADDGINREVSRI